MKTKKLQIESVYQNKVRDLLKAVGQVKLRSGKVVDLMDKNYAYEVDYVHKWAEAIGQSLQYAMESNRLPAIVFIYYLPHDNVLLNSVLPLLIRLDVLVLTIDQYSFAVKVVYAPINSEFCLP